MAYWSSESGILRKKKKDDDIDKLLIFGYACKLFKDDEKALHIDQGKHLIPWMGDETLKIDRYDCRGHLSDLSRYEASREDYHSARWLGLDENERKLEQLCDEERYYSLLNNEEEEEMYKEEQLKRNKTNEFQYSYDVPTNPDAQESIPTVPENDIDEKYEPSPDLDVPVDIQIPKTVKEYTRIEKTAIFVSTQGPQMEILIKAKQSDNPQFGFLNQNDSLYKFYRHVLDAVKNRRYRSNITKPESNTPNTSMDENNEHYLHPSLVSSVSSSTDVQQSTIPSIPYRPNANCAYSQLVSKIQGTAIAEGTGSVQPATEPQPVSESQSGKQGENAQPDLSNLTYEQQQQYYQYYVQRQYYEYYKQFMDKSSSSGEVFSQADLAVNPNMQAFVQQMMYAQYMQQTQVAQPQQQATNPYAQIVSNLCKDVPISVSSVDKPDISKDPILYTEGKDPTALANSKQHKSNIEVEATSKITPIVESPKKAALSLIQNYASDSDDDETDDDEVKPSNDIKIPDEDTKLVIDKMACYVVKNGKDFEQIVKSREDPRFVFLKEDHEYYRYYRQKVDEELEKIKVNNQEEKAKIEESKVIAGKLKEKKFIAPVSFSIKKAREDPPKEIKSALPVDEETDEEDTTNEEAPPPVPVIPQPPTLVTTKKVSPIDCRSVDTEKETKPVISAINDQSVVKPKIVEVKNEEQKEVICAVKDEKIFEDIKEENRTVELIKSNDLFVKDDPILEMIDLTEDEKKVDLVRNADIFDITSEKGGTAKENRALQLERRRKAMAFLKMKTGAQDNEQVLPESGKPTILTIDLSNVQSPKKKHLSSGSSDEDERRRRKRSRSKTQELDYRRSKKSRERDRSEGRKDREKHRKARSTKLDRINEGGTSDKEEGEMSDDSDGTKHRKPHKRKKSHKRKHSKSKHSSKSKKKSKKRESRNLSSSESDSDQSMHS